MGLETATFIASLNESWPDGLDQRTTADNHIRLLKAVLKRQFAGLDGPVSLSAIGFSYLNDLSASVQYQLNQLRDGSSTAANAVNAAWANSASVARNALAVGGISFSYIAAVSISNVFHVVQQFGGSPFGASGTAAVGFVRVFPGSAALPGYVAFYTPDGTRRGYIGFGDGENNLQIQAENGWRFEFAGTVPMYNNQPLLYRTGPINADHIDSGTIPAGRVPLAAVQQYQAQLTVGAAATAAFATSAGYAVNAGSVGGYVPRVTAAANSAAIRDESGHLYAGYFNMSGGAEAPAQPLDSVVACYNGDGFLRRIAVSTFGSKIEARNISGRAGIAKNLINGSGPPNLAGSVNGDMWLFY